MIMNRQQLPTNQGVGPFSFQGAAPAPVYPTYQAASAQTPPPFPSGMPMPTGGMGNAGTMGAPGGALSPTPAAGQPVFEESYIENILRLNLGKIATVYMTFENNSQWNAKVFKGRLEAAGRDHIILSDPTTGMRFLLLMLNLDYVTFDEELNYEYPGYTPQAAGTGR
ncbi:MAG TPA: spore coat protein GerQ [Paenibacillus sp.]|nr:spore coat protein GerQ [Paenibacillus sp.]